MLVERASNPQLPGRIPKMGREGAVGPAERYEGAAVIRQYGGETYYGIPPIKQSHYKWRTAVAFFCNSVSGGSQVLATLLDLFGKADDRLLVRAGRYLALAGGSVSTITLISALHTPQRWYNMLRIFKKTSPMSIGIWAISPFNVLSALVAMGQFAEDRGYEQAGRRIGRIFSIPAALLGGVVATYMGTELEETNMPLWASAHPWMSPLYAAAGASNSTAAMMMAADMTDTSGQTKRTLNTMSIAAGALELALSTMVEMRWRALPEAWAYRHSPYEPLFRTGVIGVGSLAPLALRILDATNDTPSSTRSMSASAAKLAGGLLLQFLMVYGGRASGRNAQDYFEYTSPGRLLGGHGSEAGSDRMPQVAERARSKAVHNRELRRTPAARGTSFPSNLFGSALLAAGAIMLVSALGKRRGESR